MLDLNPHAQSLRDGLTANAQLPSNGSSRKDADASVFTNFARGKRCRGLAIAEISDRLYQLSNGFPKRIGELLFCVTSEHAVLWLESAAQLFAWIDRLAKVVWQKGPDKVPMERFFCHLQQTAQAFDHVEAVPHFPPLAGTFYVHPPLPPADCRCFAELVGRFCPASSVDRKLIEAFFLSFFWGGAPGARPAWLVTDTEEDAEGRGRGIGKSKLVELGATLAGGMFEVSRLDDMANIKKRLLSPEGMTLRVARIDNLKTLRFSWADLESLITAPVISGHRLWKGEGRRPNTLTWTFTSNGASLATDIAKRSVIVQLTRPIYSCQWEPRTRSLIEQNRWQIISDIGHILTTSPGANNP